MYNPSVLNIDYKASLLYYIGSAYHFGHDFDNAIQYFKRYKGNLDKDFTSKKMEKNLFLHL